MNRSHRAYLPLVFALLSFALLCFAHPGSARADWRASGQFRYLDRVFGPSGFTGQLDTLPIRKAIVQVVDSASGAVLVSGGTDALGSFSLNVPDAQTRTVYVRALAYTADSSLYHLRVKDVDGGGSVFALASPMLSSHAPGADVLFNSGEPLLAMPGSTGEAFNILDCLENGVDYVADIGGVRPSNMLTALWNPTSGDGTFYSGGTIHLTKDDGYGDTVINHEEGHYMAAIFSRDDSPGGPHFLGDNNQDLRLAWSEGWATYFSLSVRRHFHLSNPSWYCDLLSEGAAPGLNFSYEIETPSILGIGAASEVSVQAALWDIADDASTLDISPGVDDENLALGDTPTWDVFRSYLPSVSGGNGNSVTLESFWDGWFAESQNHAPDMLAAFRKESIDFSRDSSESDDLALHAVVMSTDGRPVYHTFYPRGDVDWSRFEAAGGTTYVIETTDLIGDCRTVLQLYAADTTSLVTGAAASTRPDGSSRIDFTPASPGTYYVRSTHKTGVGAYGSYDLRVSAGTPTMARYEDVTAAAGVGNNSNSRGVAWGDFNNDGYPDLYVCNTGPNVSTGDGNRLFRNNAGSSFTEVAQGVGVQAGTEQHEGAAWGDYDNDGDLDLVVVGIDAAHLFRNQGPPGYHFSDVTTASGFHPAGLARTVNWVDVDRDGYLDLYVTEAGAPNELWHNNHDGTFTHVTRGVEFSGNTFSAAWTDYDGDGRPDVALGIDGDADNGAVRLLRQRDDGTFQDVTDAAGLGRPRGRVFGVAWADYDNDGHPDLVAACETGPNLLFHNRGDGTFEEVAKAAGVEGNLSATSPAWLDADNDGDLDLYVVNFNNPASFYDNLNGHSFSAAGLAGADTPARSVAAADYNLDGSMDVYVGSQSLNVLYRGHAPSGRHYLELRLVGHDSNRSGIGARIEVQAGGRRMWREVSGGQAWGSQPSLVQHFGLAGDTLADSVIVMWPSGHRSALAGVTGDRVVELDEITGIQTHVPDALALRQNQPNPFNAQTVIRFDVPRGAPGDRVRLEIFDVQGRRERMLVDRLAAPGANQAVAWDGRLEGGARAPEGVHFARLTVGSTVLTRKMLLVR